jgi:hypothetical protein
MNGFFPHSTASKMSGVCEVCRIYGEHNEGVIVIYFSQMMDIDGEWRESICVCQKCREHPDVLRCWSDAGAKIVRDETVEKK